MNSSVDKPRDVHETNGKRKSSSQITPFLEKTRSKEGVITEDAQEIPIDELPTLPIPSVGVEDMHTQVHLKALAGSPPLSPYYLMDSWAISEQPTWLLPVLRDQADSAKSVLAKKEGESYLTILFDLVKNSGIYAVASLAAPLVSLVLAPFLTRYLTHTEYGALVVLNTMIALMAGVSQLGLGDAFFPAYTYDYETTADRAQVLSTVTMTLLLISIVVTSLVFLAAPWLALVILSDETLGNLIRIVAFVIIMQNLSVPGLALLRATNRPLLFSGLSITNLLTTLILNILLIGKLQLGVSGSLLATGAGYTLIVLCTFPWIVWQTGFRIRLDMLRGLFSFGVPHAINLVSGWVLQLSDRFLLGHLGSLSQTAGYAVAYSLGSVLSAVVIAPFSLAWWSLMFPIAKREDAQRIFQLVFRWFSLVLLLATFALSRLGVLILTLFFPTSYFSSASIIPVIALSIMFNGIFVVVALGTSVKRKTWLVALLITFSALVNVALNIVLIPLYGAMGAALATLFAYMFLTIIAYFVNQRIYPVRFEVGRFTLALLLGIALYIGSEFLAQGQPPERAYGLYLCIFVLYAIVLVAIGRPSMQKLRTLSGQMWRKIG